MPPRSHGRRSAERQAFGPRSGCDARNRRARVERGGNIATRETRKSLAAKTASRLSTTPLTARRQQGRAHPRGWKLGPCLGMGSALEALSGNAAGSTPCAGRLSLAAHAVSGGPSYSVGWRAAVRRRLPARPARLTAARPHMVSAATRPRRPRARPGCRS